MVADGRPSRAEDKVRRQVGKQCSHRFRDCGVTLSRGVWFVQHGVLGIELADALLGVASLDISPWEIDR